MKVDRPTKEQVASLLSYNPETGIFTWKVDRKFSAKKGSVAGYKEFRIKKPTYIRISLFDRKYSAHHLAYLLMKGFWPTSVLDHDNRDGTDNRWSNIIESDVIKNNRNRRKHSRNTSGHTGVYKLKNGKFYAAIGVNGKVRWLGAFSDINKALGARKAAEMELGYHEKHGI